MKDKVSVFISHKHEDMDAAQLLHRKLELYGGDRVECFISEKIPYGSDWFDQIRTNLARADVVLLLFTLTDASWDWPLYEVGLATNLEDSDSERCRIVCLYPPYAQPPEPIKYAQAVKADQEGITDFLYRFFCTSEITGCDLPINLRFSEDRTELEEMAYQLTSEFGGAEPWSHCFTNYFWITVDSVPLSNQEIPAEARISPESSAFELFRLTPNPPGKNNWTWGELLKKVQANQDSSWVSDLGERFYWASRGEILKTTNSSLTCMKTSRLYRPLLHRVELKPNGAMQFEVIFTVYDSHNAGLTDATEQELGVE